MLMWRWGLGTLHSDLGPITSELLKAHARLSLGHVLLGRSFKPVVRHGKIIAYDIQKRAQKSCSLILHSRHEFLREIIEY